MNYSRGNSALPFFFSSPAVHEVKHIMHAIYAFLWVHFLHLFPFRIKFSQRRFNINRYTAAPYMVTHFFTEYVFIMKIIIFIDHTSSSAPPPIYLLVTCLQGFRSKMNITKAKQHQEGGQHDYAWKMCNSYTSIYEFQNQTNTHQKGELEQLFWEPAAQKL